MDDVKGAIFVALIMAVEIVVEKSDIRVLVKNFII